MYKKILSIINLLIIFNVTFIAKKSLCQPELPIWPTENDCFFSNAPLEKFIQPTASGNVVSGTFGFVRNNGTRFHEGIDVKSVKRNRRNHPEDNVLAVLDGTVAYINKSSGKSSYGIYVILEHSIENLHYYTLYAHLSCVDNNLKIGKKIAQKTIIGKIGNTSCSKIPLNRAHLHFEIGVKLGTDKSFANWYNNQKFKQNNFHGEWNGLNLIGLDPIDFFRSKQNFLNYLKSQEIAISLKIKSPKILTFIEKNKSLISVQPDPIKKLTGWQVNFNQLGMPISFFPLYEQLSDSAQISYVNEKCLQSLSKRNIISTKTKSYQIAKILDKIIKLI